MCSLTETSFYLANNDLKLNLANHFQDKISQIVKQKKFQLKPWKKGVSLTKSHYVWEKQNITDVENTGKGRRNEYLVRVVVGGYGLEKFVIEKVKYLSVNRVMWIKFNDVGSGQTWRQKCGMDRNRYKNWKKRKISEREENRSWKIMSLQHNNINILY